MSYIERQRRALKNAKLSCEKRYERGKFWFVAVLVFSLAGFAQVGYRFLSGDGWFVALGAGVVVVPVVLAAAYGYVRSSLERRFRGFTSQRTIPLRAVESVDPHPKRPFRRPHLVIRYDEHGDGTEKKRRVGVCSLTPLAEDEFETAKAVLLDECDLPITSG